jgi:hypothetical protein
MLDEFSWQTGSINLCVSGRQPVFSAIFRNHSSHSMPVPFSNATDDQETGKVSKNAEGYKK